MDRPSPWLRRIEIALWIFGVIFLGAAVGVTVHRWSYQSDQERALLRTAAASPLPPQEVAPVPPSPVSSLELPGDRVPVGPTAESPPDLAPEPEPKPQRPKPSLESERAADPMLLGRIEIPRIGLSAIVREGEDEATLRRAVGFIPGTARPGEGGNTALAGHRDTFFRPLRRIEEGDRIRLVVPPDTYEYRVDSLQVVEPTEVSVLASTGTEELTLVTCYPFRFIGPAPDRFIVKATRVN